jgi:hypothetical protein
VPDCFEHTVAVLGQIVIPETEDAVALRFKPAVASQIALALSVLAAVEFDDQHGCRTHQINDVSPDGDLPSKFEACQSAITDDAPKVSLGFGGVGTHRFCPPAQRGRERRTPFLVTGNHRAIRPLTRR